MATRAQELERLTEQAEQFEKEYPLVAEALKLFDLTMEQYEIALEALQSPHTYFSDAANVEMK